LRNVRVFCRRLGDFGGRLRVSRGMVSIRGPIMMSVSVADTDSSDQAATTDRTKNGSPATENSSTWLSSSTLVMVSLSAPDWV
ncbi:MAG: hypothetical protein AAGA65_31610, partial [Actinomycetota bacterium]